MTVKIQVAALLGAGALLGTAHAADTVYLPGPAESRDVSANVAARIAETPAEQQARRVVTEWYRLRETGHGREAVEKYMAKDFVSHSHIGGLNQPKDGRSDYQRELEMAERMSGAQMKLPPELTLTPFQIRVDDDLVTYYAGNLAVDIMRVKNGKITDHWDASPLDPVTLIGEKKLLTMDEAGKASNGMPAANGRQPPKP